MTNLNANEIIFGLKTTQFQPNENMVFYSISIALFDYYNATQDGLQFPTFKLLYGRTMRGPMRILRKILDFITRRPNICFHTYCQFCLCSKLKNKTKNIHMSWTNMLGFFYIDLSSNSFQNVNLIWYILLSKLIPCATVE